MMFQNILVPTDFSPHSDRAVEMAVGLAKKFGGKVHLLHSYSLPVSTVMAYDYGIPDGLWQELQTAASERLEKLREQVSSQGVEATAHATRSFPSEAIAEAAKELSADVIVMGTRGLSGLKHVFLGSVAERTLRLAPCPVLCVKSDDDDD